MRERPQTLRRLVPYCAFLRVTCPALSLAMIGACGSMPAARLPSNVKDVVAESQIASHQPQAAGQPFAGVQPAVAYVFPSKSGGEQLGFRAAAILTPSSSFPEDAARFCIQCGGRCWSKGHQAINVSRAAVGSTTLQFELDKSASDLIRSLEWNQFRWVQLRYAQWLERLAGRGGVDERAANCRLFSFWTEAIRSARLELQEPPIPRRVPNAKEIIEEDLGPTLGAVEIGVGMCVDITSGSYALSPMSQAGRFVFRPSMGGTTRIWVGRRGDGVGLIRPPFDGRIAYEGEVLVDPRDGAADWSIASIKPCITGANPSRSELPFDTDHASADWCVPFYDELDLRHPDALRPRSGRADLPLRPKSISLIVPIRYTKSDFGWTGVDTSPSKYPNAVGGANDARADPNEGLARTLSRRYMLWASSSAFDARSTGPRLLLSAKDAAELSSSWDYTPLVFGGQATATVRVPLTWNDCPADCVVLGTTWGDVIAMHGLAAGPDSHDFKERAVLVVARWRGVDSGVWSAGERIEYRIHGRAVDALGAIEVRPWDAFSDRSTR